MRGARGFTLLEVVVALAILAISLTVLLESQASSLNNAGRSRDMTVATLLTRGKMIDIEKHLFHDGFQMSTEDEDGNFGDEGYPDIKWKYRISEVELDLSALTSICGTLGGGGKQKAAAKAAASAGAGDTGATDCESMLTNVGSMAAPFIDEMGHSMRVVDLQVTWPQGRYSESMSVRALLSRDDFATQQMSDQMRMQNEMQNGQLGNAPAGAGGATGPSSPPVSR